MRALQETSAKNNDEHSGQAAAGLGKQIEGRSQTTRGGLPALRRGRIAKDLTLATRPISPLATATVGKNAKNNRRCNKRKKAKKRVSRPYSQDTLVS